MLLGQGFRFGDSFVGCDDIRLWKIGVYVSRCDCMATELSSQVAWPNMNLESFCQTPKIPPIQEKQKFEIFVMLCPLAGSRTMDSRFLLLGANT